MNITKEEFSKLTSYIKGNFGINLTEKKITLITNRLSNILDQNNFNSFSEYYNYVTNDKSGKAVIELLNKITTNHTFFCREQKHFDFLRDEVLPYLEEKENNARDIRIWSAGCSSGQEPYTLAMIIKDYFGKKHNLWDTKILATDISAQVLKKASDGIYPNESILEVSNEWKNKYFKKYDSENVKVSDDIRKEIIYKRFNLMNPFPFRKKFHVIFCRNVMIYFDTETKRKLIDKYYRAMEPGGFLFIGHSESIERKYTDFKYVQPAIYRKEL